MGWAAGIASGVGGLLGGIAGGQGKKGTQIESVDFGPETEAEKRYKEQISQQFGDISQFLQAGPGYQDLRAGETQATSQLDALLQGLTQRGGLPTSEQTQAAQQYSTQVFQPEQEALRQSFGEQEIAQQRLSAQLGRSVGDPILRAKLAQEQTRQQSQLAARQNAFAAEYGQQLPQQQLGYAQQLAQLRGGLASQALQNRMALLGLGQELRQAERQYRVAGATRVGTSSQGGGIGGAIGGALGGIGAGLNVASMFGGGGGNPLSQPMGQSFGSNISNMSTRSFGGSSGIGGSNLGPNIRSY